jgi:hypothetical protein
LCLVSFVQLLVKADRIRDPRKIIEELISDILRLKKEVRSLNAQLEDDGDEDDLQQQQQQPSADPARTLLNSGAFAFAFAFACMRIAGR